jgi:hypothetical protein
VVTVIDTIEAADEGDGEELGAFTAEAALAFGATYASTLGVAGTNAALSVAAFLMAHAGAEVVECECEECDEVEPGMPVGPTYAVRCAVEPSERAEVVGLASGRVGLRYVGEDGDAITLALTAKDARGFAAAILNAADDADGSSPLLMFRTSEEAA